jgi:glycosyltransferase involved in cell wall biosynthesis
MKGADASGAHEEPALDDHVERIVGGADGTSMVASRTHGTGRARGRPRILVLAYACDPYAGSEPGAGWAMVRAAAEVGDATALFFDGHAEAIDRWLADHPEHRDVEFVPVTVSRRRSLLGRLIDIDRRAHFVAYLRWLPAAGRVAQRLHEEDPFDVSLHGAYGSYWLPTPLVGLEGVPCVWGPVGGATKTPRSLWRYLGVAGWVGEAQKRLALAMATRLPSVRRTWDLAPVHLFETSETAEAMPEKYRDRAEVINRVLLYDLPDFVTRQARGAHEAGGRRPIMLFPSLLEPRKGPMLALHALVHTPEEVRLVFANDGYAVPALKRAARRLQVAHRVDFLGRIPRIEMLDMVRQSAAVVFTGLREEGGMALVEAMMSGAPVVVLAHGGPRLIAGFARDPDRVAIVEPGSARETAERLGAAMTAFVANPPPGTSSNIEQDGSKERLHAALLGAAAGAGRRADD